MCESYKEFLVGNHEWTVLKKTPRRASGVEKGASVMLMGLLL
jgi:hypothetical protein